MTNTSGGRFRPRMALLDYAASTAVALGVLAFVGLVYLARGALLLIFLGFFMAAGIEPGVRALERSGVRRGLAIALIVLLLLLIVAALILVLAIPAAHQIGALANDLPQRLEALAARLNLGADSLEDGADQNALSAALRKLGELLALSAATIFATLGVLLGSLFASATVLALFVYFSAAMPRILASANRALGDDPERVRVLEQSLGRIGGYVTGQATLCACIGVVSYLFFLVADVPYPALLAVVVAVFDAVPQIGATLGSIVGILAALTISFPLAVVTMVFFILYQGLENYVISPRVFSRTVELSPVAAFTAVLVGASVGGVIGVLIALPLTAALKVVALHLLSRRHRDAAEPDATPATAVT
ncbi:MAG: AI-2E family transporter [Pseudonocardiales bacterium]